MPVLLIAVIPLNNNSCFLVLSSPLMYDDKRSVSTARINAAVEQLVSSRGRLSQLVLTNLLVSQVLPPPPVRINTVAMQWQRFQSMSEPDVSLTSPLAENSGKEVSWKE